MRKLRRYGQVFYGLALLLAACVLLIACGPSDAQIEELLAAPAVEKVTVHWLVVGEGTEPWMQSAENDFVDRFNKSQDEIKLEMELGMGGGGLSDRIEAGNIPDLVGPLSPNFGSRFNEIWADIGSLAVEGSGLDAFDPTTVDAWRREGKLIGVPFGFWPAVLYYNKDIFDRAGLAYPPHQYGQDYAAGGAWSLDKVAEIGPMMTIDKSGRTARTTSFDPNTAMQWGFMIEGNDLRAAVAIFGSPSIQDASGEVRLPQAWRDASHWIHSAIWEGKFFPNGLALESTRGDPFGKGQAAMFYVSTSYLCCEVKFNYDIAAVPSFNGKITSRRDHSGFGIPQASRYQEAAMKVIMALTSDPGMIAAFRIVPARTEMRKDLTKLLSSQQPYVDWQVLVDSMNYPDDPPYSEFLPRASGAFDRFSTFAESLLTKEDLAVDDELDKLETDLQTMIGQ